MNGSSLQKFGEMERGIYSASLENFQNSRTEVCAPMNNGGCGNPRGAGKTAKAVGTSRRHAYTPLKRGVNDKRGIHVSNALLPGQIFKQRFSQTL